MEELLEKRLIELVNITNALASENSKQQQRHSELIKEIKSSVNVLENKERISEMKKLNSFTFLRLKEVEINIRVMNEIYSLLKYSGIEPKIGEKEKSSLEFNSSNFKPLFILDKGEITFLNKEAEDFILKELEKTSDADEKLIENVKNFKNGESE